MERRRFGPVRREVPIIGQGTWYIDAADPAPAIAALRRGIDLGMTHIDTAEMYGSGAAPGIVGSARGGGAARPAARCLSGLQGATRKRFPDGYANGVRALALPPRHRSPRLLSPA